jgi:hypothetical protein
MDLLEEIERGLARAGRRYTAYLLRQIAKEFTNAGKARLSKGKEDKIRYKTVANELQMWARSLEKINE